MMFRKILIPHDGSTVGTSVLPVARALALASGAQVVLVRVLPEHAAAGQGPLQAEAYSQLERIRQELEQSRLSVYSRVRFGDPAEQILATVRDEGVDLVAMATYGIAGIHRLMVGSVSEQILASTTVPVVVDRQGGRLVRELRSILVPTDGSPGAGLALGAGVPLAQSSRASLTLLRVTPNVADTEYRVDEAGELGRDLFVGHDYEEAARIHADDYVQRIAELLTAKGVHAAGVARVGNPAREIVDCARECQADLIVMSTHGLTGPARTILGSVADQVVQYADAPVLLVPWRDWLGTTPEPATEDAISALTAVC